MQYIKKVSLKCVFGLRFFWKLAKILQIYKTSIEYNNNKQEETIKWILRKLINMNMKLKQVKV